MTATGRPVAVITGGAQGMGEQIVRRFHSDGHQVAVADLDGDRAARLARELDPSGDTTRGYQVDVSDRTGLEQLRDAVLMDFGEVQVLVNNAAQTKVTPLMEITSEELRSVMAVNFEGTFMACQLFGSHMAEQRYGRIVNMGSLAGQNGGTATGGHYAASKGAILAATKVFARDLASHGVTVNAVSPGPQDSDLVRSVVGEDNLPGFLESIPVGRLGDPAFIAGMVALLASPEAASVTGACWDANGGLYVR